MLTNSPWFEDIAIYLVTWKTPPHLSTTQGKRIVKNNASYSWIQGELFYTRLDLIIHKGVREEDVFEILKEAHDEPCRGNFVEKITTCKLLHVGYFRASLFNVDKQYVIQCDNCQ